MQIDKCTRADSRSITIQCPVYKEDLNTVLEPAVQTVRDAIKTYEMQGGTASIFMNDDGIQLLNPAERKRRIAFYKQNGIAWIGRPPDGIDGFVRAGKFKKASNMVQTNTYVNFNCTADLFRTTA